MPTSRRKRRRAPLAYHERNLRLSLLSLLRREGGVPRVRMCETLGLTAAMVTRCVQRLVRERLVRIEGRSRGSGGRLCHNVALNPAAGFVAGIEYGSEEILGVAANFAGGIDGRFTFPVPADARDGTPDRLLAALRAAVRSMCEAAGAKPLLGIAAVDPGVADTVRGVAVASNILPKWTNVPVCDRLARLFRVPVRLSNTAHAILAAVDRLEWNRQYADALYVEYREGVGCALKCGGRHVVGNRGMAGEMTRLPAGGAAARARGNGPGYLEDEAGLRSVLRRLAAERHPAFRRTLPHAEAMRKVLELAAGGDRVVTRVLADAWLAIGLTCGNLVNLLNPAVLVLDPHFGQAGEQALEAIKDGIRRQMLPAHREKVAVVVSRLEEPAAPVGAALMLLDELTFGGAFVSEGGPRA